MGNEINFDFIQEVTRKHRFRHHCGAYTFEDGRGLMALVQTLKSRRILELGTALGYTACCLSTATTETLVDTIERDPQHVALARENILKAGIADRINVYEGEFASVIKGFKKVYNLIFFDGVCT